MTVLGQISSPADLKKLPVAMLATLAQEIREFLIDRVSGAGGIWGQTWAWSS
jgi:1-deoxy-D-xylulose-5-phosphate synthase